MPNRLLAPAADEAGQRGQDKHEMHVVGVLECPHAIEDIGQALQFARPRSHRYQQGEHRAESSQRLVVDTATGSRFGAFTFGTEDQRHSRSKAHRSRMVAAEDLRTIPSTIDA